MAIGLISSKDSAERDGSDGDDRGAENSRSSFQATIDRQMRHRSQPILDEIKPIADYFSTKCEKRQMSKGDKFYERSSDSGRTAMQ